MTGQQLLHELSTSLEHNLTKLSAESDQRQDRERDLEDRSLWSARRRPL